MNRFWCRSGTSRLGKATSHLTLTLLCVLLAGPMLAQQTPAALNDTAFLFHEGKLAMQSGDLALAEKDFRRVIVLDPNSSAARVNLGVAFMRGKRWDEALIEFHTAEALSPNEPGIPLNIGLVYYRKNDFLSAIEPLSASLRQQPESEQARYLLGLCYFFTNQYKPATETLAPLWDRESSKLNFLYVLSIAASKAEDAAMQKRAFDRMLAIGQNAPEFHLYLGKAWLAQHDTASALREFQAAEAGQPNLPMIHYFLGRTYLEQHAYPQAEAELKRDSALEPEFAYDYEDLGILYALKNQPERAETCFRQAIERNDLLVNSYFGLAKLYEEAGRNGEALAMADRAEAMAPTSASVRFTRGQVLKHLGRTAEAKAELTTAAKLFRSRNDRQQEPSGDQLADAESAAQQ